MGAQFRLRARFTAATRRLVPSILWNKNFARDRRKSARLVRCKIAGAIRSRDIRSGHQRSTQKKKLSAAAQLRPWPVSLTACQ
jgi:hypothetical protein